MDREVTFDVGGNSYVVRLTHRALYRLEHEFGILATSVGERITTSPQETLQALFLCGLEGARVRAGNAGEPFTAERVAMILDEMSLEAAQDVILRAYKLGMVEDPKGSPAGAPPAPSTGATSNASPREPG